MLNKVTWGKNVVVGLGQVNHYTDRLASGLPRFLFLFQPPPLVLPPLGCAGPLPLMLSAPPPPPAMSASAPPSPPGPVLLERTWGYWWCKGGKTSHVSHAADPQTNNISRASFCQSSRNNIALGAFV